MPFPKTFNFTLSSLRLDMFSVYNFVTVHGANKVISAKGIGDLGC